jgi:hypothetical protein
MDIENTNFHHDGGRSHQSRCNDRGGSGMYVSRLTFHTLPGKTQEVEQKLMTLSRWVAEAGGLRPRVMRTHYGSLGAPDLVFEQEVANPDALELQIKQVTEKTDFRQWAQQVAGLLEQSSKRELYRVSQLA